MVIGLVSYHDFQPDSASTLVSSAGGLGVVVTTLTCVFYGCTLTYINAKRYQGYKKGKFTVIKRFFEENTKSYIDDTPPPNRFATHGFWKFSSNDSSLFF